MFDSDGREFKRRPFDGWKLVPVAGTLSIAVFGWAASIEHRLGHVETVQAERGSTLAKMGEALAADPVMKPEVKFQFEQEQAKLDRLEQRVERLDERLNNFHQFIIQVLPRQMVVPPSKRGEMPFKLEDKG